MMNRHLEHANGERLISQGLSDAISTVDSLRTDGAIEDITRLKNSFVEALNLIRLGLQNIHLKDGEKITEGSQSIDLTNTKSLNARDMRFLAIGLLTRQTLSFDKQRIIFRALIDAGESGLKLKDLKTIANAKETHTSTFISRAQVLGLVSKQKVHLQLTRCFATPALIEIYKSLPLTSVENPIQDSPVQKNFNMESPNQTPCQ